ncbi:MAG TPA: hypothetical protein ENN67_04045, partial [Firmicutes bacterium]|nr:hypothetical protein [Bacillota bacterium]
MRFRALMVLVVMLTLYLIGACAHSQAPLFPTAPQISGNPADLQSVGGEFKPGHNLLGLWLITVNGESGEIIVIPARVADVHLNVLTFLEVGPCANCLKISNFEVDIDKNYLIDIQLTHPFADKPKFSGFDVRGIIMFNAGLTFEEFGKSISSLGKGTPELMNPDGYTTLYEPSTIGNGTAGYLKGKLTPALPNPTANLNGYKYYCDSIPHPDELADPVAIIDPTLVTERGVFRAGSVNTRRFKMKTNNPMFTFGYAVDASWEKPTEPVNIPSSFPIEANCTEAWLIQANMAAPLSTTIGAKANLIIDVYDWQGASTIDTVSVECAPPVLWEGIIEAVPTTGGPGTKRFTAELINEFGYLPPGSYQVLIQVTDTNSAPGALIDKTAWQVVRVPVIVNNPPVCSAIVSTHNPAIGEQVTFTDTSTDPQGQGDLKESWWDWDNDGTWDEEGFEVTHAFNAEGVYKVNHKVIDNAGAEATLPKPIELDVGLYVRLIEDLESKPENIEYRYLTRTAGYGTGGIINVGDLDGPWDFTTIDLSTPESSYKMVRKNDPEVSSFVNEFNVNTTHFMKSTNMYDPFLPVIYQAEYHYFGSTAERLYIYGFYDPYILGAAKFGPPDTEEN